MSLTKLLECYRNVHSGGVYECEEQNVCSVLLVRVKFGLPVEIVRVESRQMRISIETLYCQPAHPGSVSSASRMYIPITFFGIPS